MPPHIHPTQDEFIYTSSKGASISGSTARKRPRPPGDLVRLPMGVPHGIFNTSGATAKCLFWVSPTRQALRFFWGIHNMTDPTPEKVVALSAQHEVNFLPPPPGEAAA